MRRLVDGRLMLAVEQTCLQLPAAGNPSHAPVSRCALWQLPGGWLVVGCWLAAPCGHPPSACVWSQQPQLRSVACLGRLQLLQPRLHVLGLRWGKLGCEGGEQPGSAGLRAGEQ